MIFLVASIRRRIGSKDATAATKLPTCLSANQTLPGPAHTRRYPAPSRMRAPARLRLLSRRGDKPAQTRRRRNRPLDNRGEPE